MVPSAISLRASFTDNSGISFFDLSSTPGTSVSSNSRLAFSAPRHRTGKSVGVDVEGLPRLRSRQRRQHRDQLIADQLIEQRQVDFLGSPTKPRSTTFSICEPGSTMVRVAFDAVTMLPSLPHRPTALPPASLI